MPLQLRKGMNKTGYLGYLIIPVSASHLLNENCITAVTHIIERAIYVSEWFVYSAHCIDVQVLYTN